MASRLSATDFGAWGLVLSGFGCLVTGVGLWAGLPGALALAGVLLLWAGLRAARRPV
jgi:hypothetical protein